MLRLLLALLIALEFCVCWSSEVEIVGFLDAQGSIAIDEFREEVDDQLLGSGGVAEVTRPWESGKEEPTRRFRAWSSRDCGGSCLEEFTPESKCVRERIKSPCRVPSPRGYSRPSWPQSVHKVRKGSLGAREFSRLPKGEFQVHGNDITFDPSSTQNYVQELLKRVPSSGLGPNSTRLVLDLQPRVGNLALELEKLGALTLSLSDTSSKSDAPVVILERGLPSLVRSLSANKRLPFPSEAFDLIHCGNCSVAWTSKGGLALFEADRVLQRGGRFVWINTESSEALWSEILRLTDSLCWNLSARQGKLAVWEKPSDGACYQSRNISLCDQKTRDDAWDVPLQPCMVGPSTLNATIPWPSRLTNSTHRITGESFQREAYQADLNYWKMLTDVYLRGLGHSRVNSIRNVLDANAGYGGFAAALATREPAVPWWILSVTPVGSSTNRLMNIFDRGLLGTYHDWCKPLSMSSRAFDLIHSSRLFSGNHRCGIEVIMLEMDRLLRPGGFAMIRDDVEVLLDVQDIANALHWKTTIQDTDSGPFGRDKIMHCQKS